MLAASPTLRRTFPTVLRKRVGHLLRQERAQPTVLSKPEFNRGKSQIGADYVAAKTACKTQVDNARDICIEEAKGKQKVARANLQYAYSGKPGDLTQAEEAKAKAVYEVAKEKCDDLVGNDKSVCAKEARAVEVKALANARMVGKIGDTQREGVLDKVDADYKVAAEKCDTLAGEAKASCVASAKTKFGKP